MHIALSIVTVIPLLYAELSVLVHHSDHTPTQNFSPFLWRLHRYGEAVRLELFFHQLPLSMEHELNVLSVSYPIILTILCMVRNLYILDPETAGYY